jgi:hypothetical protein
MDGVSVGRTRNGKECSHFDVVFSDGAHGAFHNGFEMMVAAISTRIGRDILNQRNKF